MRNTISAFRIHNSLSQLKMQFSVFWSEWIFNQNSSSHKINQEQNSLSLQQNLALNSTSSSNWKRLNTLIQNWILRMKVLSQITNFEFKMFLFSFNESKTLSASEKKNNEIKHFFMFIKSSCYMIYKFSQWYWKNRIMIWSQFLIWNVEKMILWKFCNYIEKI